MIDEVLKMYAKGKEKDEKQRLEEQKRAERQRKQLERLCKPAPGVEDIVRYRNAWARNVGQSNRRLMERAERNRAIVQLGPINHLAALVVAMAWHPHHAYILVVATDPGVTCEKLTDFYNLNHSNHRVLFRRLNTVLKQLGWHFVSYPRGAPNEPWGWALEKIPG
ncbi:hypothetical protein KAM479_38190 [Aeromonas caviae]|uniref:hypothetical protein n=1 Tax=Aeromonas caviae TaxID=648 RepID=UPI001FC86493|nr:hypothetical protein [Aeromonas caviae]BDN94044.1 hypothetical protein KAM497c_35880 [Aeromonas caviae]GKR71898.1 hypothetical protein KAM479_38190 [Aeromonas caviae]